MVHKQFFSTRQSFKIIGDKGLEQSPFLSLLQPFGLEKHGNEAGEEIVTIP